MSRAKRHNECRLSMTEATGLTTEMLMILGILGLTVYLFISEVVRIDVAGLFILTLLGITSYLPGLTPLIEPAQLFSGFSGNAVISIIAVMIIGAGLDKTGIIGLPDLTDGVQLGFFNR